MTPSVQPACEPLITTEEAAQAIGLSTRQVRRLAASREVQAFKFGKEWKFRKSLLDEWARRQLESSHTQVHLKGSGK